MTAGAGASLRYTRRLRGRRYFEIRHGGQPVGQAVHEASGGYSVYLAGRQPSFQPTPQAVLEHVNREMRTR